MPDYEVNLSEALAALMSDPEKAAKILVDTADELTNLGAFEPVEEVAKQAAKEYIVRGLTGLQQKAAAVTWTAEG